MNYLALGLGILALLIALNSLCHIGQVAIGRGRWHDRTWGFLLNALPVAIFGTLAAWLFGMVAA